MLLLAAYVCVVVLENESGACTIIGASILVFHLPCDEPLKLHCMQASSMKSATALIAKLPWCAQGQSLIQCRLSLAPHPTPKLQLIRSTPVTCCRNLLKLCHGVQEHIDLYTKRSKLSLPRPQQLKKFVVPTFLNERKLRSYQVHTSQGGIIVP